MCSKDERGGRKQPGNLEAEKNDPSDRVVWPRASRCVTRDPRTLRSDLTEYRYEAINKYLPCAMSRPFFKLGYRMRLQVSALTLHHPVTASVWAKSRDTQMKMLIDGVNQFFLEYGTSIETSVCMERE